MIDDTQKFDGDKPNKSSEKKPYEKKYGDKKPYNKDGKRTYGKKPYDKNNGKSNYGDKYGKRNDYKKNENEQLKSEEPKAVKTIKLRLDVKDVVRPRNVEDNANDPDQPIILFEDNHLLVVVKPQNVPSQADSTGDDDMLSKLKRYLIKKYDKPGNAYLGLVQRLDRPTGGVMVFAKTSKAAARLCESIREGEVEKRYAAVVVGKPNRVGKIEHYLVKDEKANMVTLAPSTLEGAKRAEAEVSIVEENDGRTLVSVNLITGRAHQARVQLKALSSPIVGDKRYGGDKYVQSPHLALWAYKLVFAHPVTGEIMRFIALPPDEFPWNNYDLNALVDLVRPIERSHY